jgi:hypothetical protein
MLLLLACTGPEPADSVEDTEPVEVVDTSPPWVAPDVVVNEFMADNETVLVLEDGTSPDWVELFNRGRQVDLEGWGLSDDSSDPHKQRLSGSMDEGAHLLVVLDFGLSTEGEQVGLYGPGGVAMDRVDFGAQGPDIAAARSPDGGTEWVFVVGGTPGEANE